ncbi:LuxR C-terminal-related transcriptional regulator [Undibacterium sp. Di26W]|uniref:response regulator transcription factor n=1 Tax=Undibacterium sp. Di26W TaxID=3413035 RepID=UPI003BF1F148
MKTAAYNLVPPSLFAEILEALDKVNEAIQAINEALVLAESGGYIRIFVDEGAPMEGLLSKVAKQAIQPNYVSKLLSIFALQKSMEHRDAQKNSSRATAQPIESYSPRELNILRLMHLRRSNQEISERLFLSLSTVKWHNQNIFGKLQVQRRTEAVARAIELKLTVQ